MNIKEDVVGLRLTIEYSYPGFYAVNVITVHKAVEMPAERLMVC